MGRTRIGRTDGRTDGLTDGRTDGRTDGQGGDYMLPRNFSGSITNCINLMQNTKCKTKQWIYKMIHKMNLEFLVSIYNVPSKQRVGILNMYVGNILPQH